MPVVHVQALYQREEEWSRQLQAHSKVRSYLQPLHTPHMPAAGAGAPPAAERDPEQDALCGELTAELARWTEDLNVQLVKHQADYEVRT